MTTPTLRPYQSTAVAEIRAALSRGHRSVLFVLPTGGGKRRGSIYGLVLLVRTGSVYDSDMRNKGSCNCPRPWPSGRPHSPSREAGYIMLEHP